MGESAQLPIPEHCPVSFVLNEGKEDAALLKFLLFCLLLVLCWPVAVLALLFYPVIWLLLLPFRLLGFAVEGVLAFIKALFMLPARVLGGGR
jgi:hypothetical protein